MNIIYAALAGALLMLVSFIGGCHYEQDKAEAQAASVRAQDVQIAKAMEPQLTHTLVVSGELTTTLASEVPHVTNFYIPKPGVAPVERPAYLLTIGSVSLWNTALGAEPTAGPSATAPGADPLALSPITFDEAETNAILNFGQYRDCRTIVTGWQEWFKKVSEVKP